MLINFGLMIIFGAAIALVAKKLNQPILLGYVLAGLLIGPAMLGLIPDANQEQYVAEVRSRSDITNEVHARLLASPTSNCCRRAKSMRRRRARFSVWRRPVAS